MTLSQPNTLIPRRPSRSAQRTLEANVEHINALATTAFVEAYFPAKWSRWTNPRTTEVYELTSQTPPELSDSQFQTCFELIEKTSGDDYKNSSSGWSEPAKKKEMMSPGLRYILIHHPSSQLDGFLSFMPTFEAGQPVLYIYEIHLSPAMQGSGLGSHLIRNLIQPLSRKIDCLDKVMLTCFKSNEVAWRFYTKMGFVTDDSSPEDRRLRGGRVVTSDYVILSWRIGRRPLGDGDGG